MSVLAEDRRKKVIARCESFLGKLQWTWEHPRLVDWLKRVMKIKKNVELKSLDSVPTDYLLSLSYFLEYRYQCSLLLIQMQADWSHPLVKTIEKKYRCFAQLPLKGYK